MPSEDAIETGRLTGTRAVTGAVFLLAISRDICRSAAASGTDPSPAGAACTRTRGGDADHKQQREGQGR